MLNLIKQFILFKRNILILVLFVFTLTFAFSACGGGGGGDGGGGLPPDGSGAGILSNPYIVGSETTLRYVGRGADNPDDYKDWTLDKHYKQIADIELAPPVAPETSNWTPIGDNSTGNDNSQFTGSFNGNAKKIIGLTINRPSDNYQGLFGYISGTNAVIKDLGLENVSITGNNRVGGVAGYMENSRSIIQNCYSTGDVTGNSTVGGVVGYTFGIIQNCYATGDVTGVGEAVGGVVGFGGRMVQNCYATGDVTGRLEVGGVVGLLADPDGTVQNCYATGDVTGDAHVGGVVGMIGLLGGYGGYVQNCYSTGDVTGVTAVGGVAGWMEDSSIIQNCYSTGDVTGGNGVGGVAGINGIATVVQNCYATGDVTGVTAVGGVVGSTEESLRNCVALNTTITRTSGSSSTSFGRVSSYGWTLLYNYANQDMTLEALSGSVSFAGANTHDGFDGVSFDAAYAKTKSWWIEPGRWYENESGDWWVSWVAAFKWDFEGV